ncbi:hypothetical protein [Flavobacterium covae]|uniref:hypothetical protein n=1 Tax=Flavobacterium covae TaxID=2906076 RepID=UPI000745CF3E|nr:hypothetical protein [Flavobacterium covae]AMA48985.1 hypothetical protein AWN65_05660 [Flavobacterium covae]MCJ1809904.1 hypothetical protein [Flavobacterium covae]
MSNKDNKKASEKKEALREKAINFFKENPTAPAVYGTIDGFLFTHKKFAENHAVTLEGQEVINFKNPNDIDVETEELETQTEE